MQRKKRGLGLSFTDEVAKVTFGNKHFKKVSTEEWKDSLIPNYDPMVRYDLEKSFWRSTTMFSVMIIFFFALFLRLFHLQISSGKTNRDLADGNRIQIKVIHAPRGIIYDRNGKILAANSPGFRLYDPKNNKSSFLTREQFLEMEAKNDSRVSNLEVDSIRKYPRGEEISHVVGYVGEISTEELKQDGYKGYRAGDRVGKSGIENYYEKLLKGVDGGEIIEIDAQGKKLRTLRTVPPKAGSNIYLTIDADLQQQVFKHLSQAVMKSESCCGAVVAQDPNTGEVLSLVSFPSFDNNIFSDNQKNDLISDILNNPNAPVLNRSIGGTYPPASTYKIVSSLAALESGKIDEKFTIEDTGQIFLGSFKFTNWFFTQYGKTEGSVDLVKALKRSNDTYFYIVSQKIGEQAMIDWSKKLYLGKTLGIDLYGESKGLVADDKWKQDNYDQPWYPGDTLHMSIGQGFLLTTPLQVNGYTSFIASNGTLYKPRLLLKVTDSKDTATNKFENQKLVENLVKPKHIDVIKKGLEEVTLEGGTAWPFLTFPIKTAGKTGTAEFGHPKNETHAWYTGYAPADDPKIAVTALIEAGGEGSSVASPVVKEIFRWFLSNNKADLIKDTNFVATNSAKILGE